MDPASRARQVHFTMRLTLSSNPQVVKIYQESAQEYRAIFADFVQRHVRLLDTVASPLTLRHSIASFPLSAEGSSLWYGTDLSKYILIQPTTTDLASENNIHLDQSTLIQLADIQVEFSDELDARMSCMLLSCLLQYTPTEFSTYRYLGALRRCILSDLVQAIKSRSLVQFDTGNLHAALEEWIGMPRDFHADAATPTSPTEKRHRIAIPKGRSAGMIVTGPKGVGKTHFSRELMRIIRDYVPWMVTLLTQSRLEDPNAVDQKTDQFFDDRLINDYAKKSDKKVIETIFDAIKAVHVPGKIVMTFIDDVDSLISSDLDIAADLKERIETADYEFFILGATGDDYMAGAKTSYHLQQFRTLKVFNMSLEQSYDYIVDNICNPPLLPFPKSIIRLVKSCGRAVKSASTYLTPSQSEQMLAVRKNIELRLHNMNIGDLNKIVLQTCIFLANRFSEAPDSVLADDHAKLLRLFENSLETVVNSIDVLMGLSPEVISSSDWIRHDTHFHPSIPGIVQSIYQKATNYGQYVHFVKLVPPGESVNISVNLESLEQSDHLLPSSSAFSLLYHLHRVFAFNASYTLESADQLLNSGKKNPTSNGAIPPRNGSRPGNPFDDFFWHHNHALLLMPNLETLVGFQQETIISTTTSRNTSRSVDASTGSSHALEDALGFTVGLGGNIQHSALVAEATSAGLTNETSRTGGASLGPLSLTLGGTMSWGWVMARDLAKTLLHAMTKQTGLEAQNFFSGRKTYMNTFDRSLSQGNSSGESVDKAFEQKRTFRHPEAMTKFVVGLRNVSESRASDLEELRNIVIIFYSHDGCYKEVVRNRLGWNAGGEYPSRPVGCQHYKHSLRMKAPCCGQWVDCEHCHDERFPDHRMNRKEVTEIQCLHCYTRQPVGQSDEAALRCSNACCGRKLSTSCCTKCRVWREYLAPDGMKHCDQCNECYPMRYFAMHAQVCRPPSPPTTPPPSPSTKYSSSKTARAIEIMRTIEREAGGRRSMPGRISPHME